jgi:DNA mismatch repair protein MutL
MPGAREVRVDMDQGGAALIRVSDDGCGMSREDALLSLERHATSKLRTAGDLAAIRTLGFRGEAVPSIASVSRFRMVTREADAVAGTEIVVDGGKTPRRARGRLRARHGDRGEGLVFQHAGAAEIPARGKHRVGACRAPAPAARAGRAVGALPPAARRPRGVRSAAGGEGGGPVRQLLGHGAGARADRLPLTHGHGVSVEGFVLPASHARKGRRHQFVFLNGGRSRTR